MAGIPDFNFLWAEVKNGFVIGVFVGQIRTHIHTHTHIVLGPLREGGDGKKMFSARVNPNSLQSF